MVMADFEEFQDKLHSKEVTKEDLRKLEERLKALDKRVIALELEIYKREEGNKNANI